MSEIRTVIVVGCGVIGMGWATLFLAHGLRVIITDPAEGAEERFEQYLKNALPLIAAREELDALAKNYQFVKDVLPILVEADFVQENGPERVEWKEELLGKLDKHTRRGVVIASSSSGLPSSAFIGKCDVDPSRVLIGHPFNPPHLIPLVEVVPHPYTSQDAIQTALTFYRSLDKKPILLHKEIPGFVSNRLQAAINNEAYSLISRGIVSAEDLDAAVTSGPGLRWALTGPVATNALGGGGGVEGFANRINRLGPSIRNWEEDMLRHSHWNSDMMYFLDDLLPTPGHASGRTREANESSTGLGSSASVDCQSMSYHKDIYLNITDSFIDNHEFKLDYLSIYHWDQLNDPNQFVNGVGVNGNSSALLTTPAVTPTADTTSVPEFTATTTSCDDILCVSLAVGSSTTSIIDVTPVDGSSPTASPDQSTTTEAFVTETSLPTTTSSTLVCTTTPIQTSCEGSFGFYFIASSSDSGVNGTYAGISGWSIAMTANILDSVKFCLDRDNNLVMTDTGDSAGKSDSTAPVAFDGMGMSVSCTTVSNDDCTTSLQCTWNTDTRWVVDSANSDTLYLTDGSASDYGGDGVSTPLDLIIQPWY
ncbi:putative hydroxyacyl-CoA dehydrogenase, partial [Aureobasidium melanogenum]